MLSDQQLRSLIRIDTPQDRQSQSQSTLDVSHQQLRKLKQIQLRQFPVQRVNASYNYFKDFKSLNFSQINQKQQLPIKWLDISFNFFKSIDETSQAAHVLQYLKYLNISANKLEAVDFSQIQTPFLEVLNISSNQVQFFLECPQSMKVLVMDHNRLGSLAFQGGENLNVLSASNNSIKKIGIKLKNLMLLDVDKNKVEDLQMVKQCVSYSKQLLSVNFENNPVSSIASFRIVLLQNCPKITQINNIVISPHIRQGFKILKSQQKLEQMLDNANKKYAERLKQKQKIKEQLLKKMKEQEKIIQEKFNKGLDEEKKQFQMLQNQAKGILGRSKLKVEKQKDQFKTKLDAYGMENKEQQQNVSQIVQIQQQHLKQYLQYLKRKPQVPKVRQKPSKTTQKIVPLPSFKSVQLFDLRCLTSLMTNYKFNPSNL